MSTDRDRTAQARREQARRERQARESARPKLWATQRPNGGGR